MKFEFDFAMFHTKKKVFCWAATLLFCFTSHASGTCEAQLSKGVLKRFAPAHLSQALEILNDPDVAMDLHNYLPEEMPKVLEQMIQHQGDSIVATFWVHDELTALTGLQRDQEQLNAVARMPIEQNYLMLWFAVKHSSQGRGYGFESTKKFLKFYFENTELPGVFACFRKENKNSKRLIQKLGFQNAPRKGNNLLVCVGLSREQFFKNRIYLN